MYRRVRRSLVLAATLALLVGVTGAAAPIGLAKSPTATTIRGIDVDASTIPQLQALMNRHRLTSVQLVQFYLQRIKKLNPKLHAVITVSPTALKPTPRPPTRPAASGDRRPLLGIPIIVKDNVDTTGMPTTAGSWALAGSTPDRRVHRPAPQGRRRPDHRQGQPVASGRTSGPAASSSGWSGDRRPDQHGLRPRPQPVRLELRIRRRRGRGPRDRRRRHRDRRLDRLPVRRERRSSGSSRRSGSGAGPASCRSRAEQDTAGPIARNVTDAAVLLGAATGVDPNDAATAAQAGHAFTDYTQFLDAHALEGRADRRLARGNVRPDADRPRRRADPDRRHRHARGPGRDGRRPDRHRPVGRLRDTSSRRCCASSRATSRRTSTRTPRRASRRPWPDLIAFNQAHPELEGPWNDAVFEAAEATNGRRRRLRGLPRGDDPANPGRHRPAHGRQRPRRDRRPRPTAPAWPNNANADKGDLDGHFEYFVGTSTAAAVAGYGAITVPAAYVAGLPVGSRSPAAVGPSRS